MAWIAGESPDLYGYRLFYREWDRAYDFDYPAWEGTESRCTIAFDPLADTIYCFVVRAVDIRGGESDNSNEACYEPAPTAECFNDGDSDGDVDGSDLAAMAAALASQEADLSDLTDFATVLGRADCEVNGEPGASCCYETLISDQSCMGDLDGDGDIDGSDLAYLATVFDSMDADLPDPDSFASTFGTGACNE